jgi:hypothetical protein
MGNSTYLVHAWQDLTGRDAPHRARLVRALQLDGKMPVGKQGKAALLSGSALTHFVLADATGESIAGATQRAATWGSVVRDYSNGVTTGRGRSQAETSWWAWRDSVRGEAEATDANAQYNILPGANVLEGVAAILERMADSTPNVPLYGDRKVTFNELVSYVGFRIDLLVGENEGPTVIIRTMHGDNRYSLQVQPTVARCPIKSVITIEVRHLIVLSRVLETAKARISSAQSVPPVPPASPAGSGNGNAEAVPTASAPTPDLPSSPADRTAAHAHQEPSVNKSEPRVCVGACARAAKGVPYSQLAHGASFDDFLAVFDNPHLC